LTVAQNFYDEFVKLSYRVEHRGDPNPTAEKLTAWDETMHARYGAFLSAALAEQGIPDTRRNRSILAFLAQSSAGSGAEQVRRAAAYWSEVVALTL
jgi:hypothetical protein